MLFDHFREHGLLRSANQPVSIVGAVQMVPHVQRNNSHRPSYNNYKRSWRDLSGGIVAILRTLEELIWVLYRNGGMSP
jgi:hypothetical protein